jgi:hypothetical protein
MSVKLAFLAVAVVTSVVSAADINCIAGATSVPVFNPTSTSGTVGDYTLDCTGGTPVSSGLPLPEINVTSFMNVAVLTPGTWTLTDGVHNFPGVLGLSNVVEFIGVPFDPPGAGHVTFEVEGIQVNPSDLPPGAQFREVVDVTSTMSFGISNPDQLVGVNAPEPVTVPLLVLGIGAVVWQGRRRQLS